MRKVPCPPLMLMVCILLVAAIGQMLGAEMTIRFKDGRTVSYDTGQISDITFRETAGGPAVTFDFLKPDRMIAGGAYSEFRKITTPMTLRGKSFSLFVLQHPGSNGSTTVIYSLGGRASRFTAVVGIDQSMVPTDRIGQGATVNYLIYTDGQLAWQSGLVNLSTPPKAVDVSLAGVQELKLVVTNGGDNSNWDWAIWADPLIR